MREKYQLVLKHYINIILYGTTVNMCLQLP